MPLLYSHKKKAYTNSQEIESFSHLIKTYISSEKVADLSEAEIFLTSVLVY